jgi:anti-sigma factor RsiW
VISCGQVVAELSSCLDDRVAADLRREIEAHLAKCAACTAVYDSTRRTLTIVTESRTIELPEVISGRIVAGIMSRVRKRAAASPR